MGIDFFFDDEVVPFENEIVLVEGEVVPFQKGRRETMGRSSKGWGVVVSGYLPRPIC